MRGSRGGALSLTSPRHHELIKGRKTLEANVRGAHTRTNEIIAPRSYARAHTQPVSRREESREGICEKETARPRPPGKRLYPFQKYPGSSSALSKDGRNTWREEGGAAPAQQVRRGRWRMTR